MEVLPCSGVQYVGESDHPVQSSGKDFVYDGKSTRDDHGQKVQLAEGRIDDILQNVEGSQMERQGGDRGTVDDMQTSEGCCNGASRDSQVHGQKSCCGLNSYDHDDDGANEQNDSAENSLASENCHLIVDTIENELPNGNREGESSFSEPAWLEGDESIALWVKWRGKWQAGIRCARADWPLSTLKAKPTHDRKKYFVIFFPHTRNYSWADMLLVRSINEFPEPIAYKTHLIGLKMVKDLTVARRFIMQKLAVGMLNVVDQFHTEALVETARDVMVWKEFAMEASRCCGYSDLGRMLLKLQNMISQRYINSDWLQNSFNSWVQRCEKAYSAESVEMLKEELFDAIRWNEVNSLRDAPIQPTLGSEWRTWKQEVMKWFSTSHPIISSGDVQQQGSDSPLTASLQVSRKRPKLEVRRAEPHAVPVGSRDPDQAVTLHIDSVFFNRDAVNDATVASEPSKEAVTTTDCSGDVTDKWNGFVVEAESAEVRLTKDVELTPTSELTVSKSLDSANKNRQCIAFIESKGRQCVRWANDGDVYCCVHLSSRFIGNSTRAEGILSVDTPLCEGTTVLGNRCKHRSLPGSSFCKKHRPKTDMKKISNSSENTLKRKHEESNSSLETTYCKEIVLAGDVESPLQVAPPVSVMAPPVSVKEKEAFLRSSSLVEKPDHLAEDFNRKEVLYCIGSCLDDNNSCPESPKRYSLYCEKHLPSWLKRARNGKSKIISKEVFVDLLSDCHTQAEKVCVHLACDLFYRFFKSILSLRNPVPKEVQFQWALSEASKDISVREFFTKLVCNEKERLRRIWGFNADEDALVFPSAREEPAQLPLVVYGSHDNEKIIRCKTCSEEFLDDQTLGHHWMDNHKKEAQWLFRGYACSICLDSFTNRKVLETHVQERHHVQFVEQCLLLQCIPCGNHFGNTNQLWSHVISAHPVDLRLPKEIQQTMPTRDESPPKLEPSSSAFVENKSENLNGLRKFICRFCGLKFDLLPDLGRHHQAAHMGPSLVSSRPAKKGVRYYAYKLKSGRLSLPKFKKGLAAASYRIRNRAADNMKKRIQASKSLSIGGTSVVPHVTEAASLGRLAEAQCSSVAKVLFSEIQKTKPRPNNFDILSVARSTCCKISLKASLEAKYGLLPERLYLKAAKLCSEHNINVNWHRDGFICPKGCKVFKDHMLSPLESLTSAITSRKSACSSGTVDEELKVDECHYIIDSCHLRQRSREDVLVLCDDISFGKESVPVACVVDKGLLDGSDGQSSRHRSWENFTYIKMPLLDQSLALDPECFQMGCACSHLTCHPQACNHVYLFNTDYDDAKDIYGKTMNGRFPYDDQGRIILEEGYLVYECNQMCSCSRACPNRVLQNGVRVKLEVFKTEKKGWGVRASEAILRGTFICEFIGEVLDEHEANTRRKRYGEEGCTYLYEIDDHVNDMSRIIKGEPRFVIDATKYGNVSRFINHSCSPNLVSYQVLVESMDSQRSHIGLYANRDIAVGEEFTHNYQYPLLPGEGYPCQCEASVCRGRLY